MKKDKLIKETAPVPELFGEIKSLIERARFRVAAVANEELSILYWRVGTRLRSEILKGRRAGYGEQIVLTLSKQLTAEFGPAGVKNISGIVSTSRRQFRMKRFSPRCVENSAGLISGFCHTFRTNSNVSSISSCAATSIGASGGFKSALIPCCSSAPQYRKNRKKLLNTICSYFVKKINFRQT